MAVGEQEVEHEPVGALAVLQHVPASRVSVVVNILVTKDNRIGHEIFTLIFSFNNV